MAHEKLAPLPHRGFWRELGISFDAALARLPETLEAEGFGIITQINLQEILNATLGIDFRRYRIFGTSNPALCQEALEVDPQFGIILSCNVVLYEDDARRALLGIMDPTEQLGERKHVGHLALARATGEKLERVVAALDT
jgi:uncharacterized protein (DUF302 family)